MTDQDCGCGAGPCDCGEADTPPLDDLYQLDDSDLPATPVRVVGGPLPVDVLPTGWGNARTVELPADGAGVQPLRLLGEDPRRARVQLWVVGTPNVIVSSTQAGCQLGGATLTEAAGPLTLTVTGEVWVRAASDAASLSLVVEQWSR